MTTIIDLLCNIGTYTSDASVAFYFDICQMDLTKLDVDSVDFRLEIDRFVYVCLHHPFFINKLCTYISTKKFNLDFLIKFSAEQKIYITNLELSDTKLLACAGSGKTRSIIGRIRFMVEYLGVDPNYIFM